MKSEGEKKEEAWDPTHLWQSLVSHSVLNAYQEREREQGRFLKEGKSEVHPNEEVSGCPHCPVVIEMVKSGAEKNKEGYKQWAGVKQHPQIPSQEE